MRRQSQAEFGEGERAKREPSVCAVAKGRAHKLASGTIKKATFRVAYNLVDKTDGTIISSYETLGDLLKYLKFYKVD